MVSSLMCWNSHSKVSMDFGSLSKTALLALSSIGVPPKVVIHDSQYAHSPASTRPRLPVAFILVRKSSSASRFQVPASNC